MNVTQLNVLIEHGTGRVSEVTDILGSKGVNIRGFSVSDTAEHGVVRLIVDDPAAGHDALAGAGFTVEDREVLCLRLPDTPGGLAGVLKVVAEAGVNIEFVYSLISTHVVLEVADVDRTAIQLEGRPVHLVTQEEIGAL